MLHRWGSVMRVLGWILCAMMALVVPTHGMAQAKFDVLDVKALPPIEQVGAQVYQDRFINYPTPRAFAIGRNGKYGSVGGTATLEDARARALKSCTDRGGENCTIYAENLEVVWPGRKRESRMAPPETLFTTGHSEFVPDNRFFWYGPETAKGIVVFAHRYSGNDIDERMAQSPGWTRVFNNNGYDVARFARDRIWDGQRDEVAKWLRTGLAEIRKRGWHHIVVVGQSRGAYTAMQALDTPGLADVVIAGAPAAYGGAAGNNLTLPDIWTMFGQAAAPLTRVAILQFDGDINTPDPGYRTNLINDRLRPRVGALLLIDRPPEISGEGGQFQPAFNNRFAGCLWRFATDPTPPSAC